MYRLFFIYVLLITADLLFGQQVASLICRGNMGRYCRPSSPRRYVPFHSNYHGPVGGTATVTAATSPIPTTVVQTTPAPATTFEDLAQNLIAAETAIRTFCLNNPVDVKEIYGRNFYVLNYTIPNLQQNEVTVRIMHRVINVEIVKSGVITFRDLRILVHLLDTTQASWAIAGNYLEIYIPYVQLDVNQADRCPNINSALINVPKSGLVPRYGSMPTKMPEYFQGYKANAQNGVYLGSTENGQDQGNDGSLRDAINAIYGNSDDVQMIDVRNNYVL